LRPWALSEMAGSELERLDVEIEEAELSAEWVCEQIDRSHRHGWRDAEAAQRELLSVIKARLAVLRACRAIHRTLSRSGR
jgi:hypothetical protein